MNPIKFREIKKEIRIIGIDDTPFIPKTKGTTQIIGVIFRGRFLIEGVLQTTITIDGFDVTRKIIEMISESPHLGQLRVIMLDGITFGGFNIIDLDLLFQELALPIIVVCDKDPNFASIKEAIQFTENWEKRWALIQKSGNIYHYNIKDDVKAPIYFQLRGLELNDAERILKLTAGISHIPEPIRVAHLIARSFL